MLSFSTALQDILDTAVSKSDWSNKIFTALGASRTLTGKRDTVDGDVFNTGTTFLSADLTGTMSATAGNIVTFGAVSNATVKLAADLSTGFSVLRISGNGHWMEGTLGLTGSGADFTVRSNPTTTTGIGFGTCSVLAPRFMASGYGPAVPALTANTPYSITIEDWTSGSAVIAGSASFDTRVDDLVFEDAGLSAEIGDVGVYQSSTSITHGNFEFGIMLLRSAASNTDAGTAPLEQVLICCKPLASTGWTSYPAMNTYNRATHSTYPPPFKVRVKRSDGAVVGTIEMRDGLPVNSPSLSQTWGAATPVRPHFNCGMMLPWQSDAPRKSSRAGKIFNGIDSTAMRQTSARQQASFLANIPIVLDGYNSANSLNHWFAMNQWPGVSGSMARQSPTDIYLFNPNGGTAPYQSYGTGWGYEPGSISGHDWFSGPGGPRTDRSTIPTVLAIYGTDSNYVRPEGGVPIKPMVDAWGLAYFNHSNHWVTNVKTFATIPDTEALNGDWVFAHAYYGGGPYANGPSKCIDLAGVSASGYKGVDNYDASGRFVWGSWSENSLHSYNNPAWHTLLLNSPAHAVLDKFKFNAQWMSSLGNSAPNAPPVANFFFKREQAWRWLHYVMSWAVGSRSSLTYTRKQIEDRFQIELELVYTDVYKPVFIDNSQSYYMVGIRNLGTAAVLSNDTTHIQSDGGNLGYYFSHVLQLMKVTGFWAAMKAKSTKCSLALDLMIHCLDKFSIDWILDTDGYSWDSYEKLTAIRAPGYSFTAADMPTSWANWLTIRPKGNASQDWVHDAAGVLLPNGDWDVAMHLKAQWPSVHKTWFPEYANARMDAAIAKYQGYYDQITARLVPLSGDAKRNADWTYRSPPLGLLNPTEV